MPCESPTSAHHISTTLLVADVQLPRSLPPVQLLQQWQAAAVAVGMLIFFPTNLPHFQRPWPIAWDSATVLSSPPRLRPARISWHDRSLSRVSPQRLARDSCRVVLRLALGPSPSTTPPQLPSISPLWTTCWNHQRAERHFHRLLKLSHHWREGCCCTSHSRSSHRTPPYWGSTVDWSW